MSRFVSGLGGSTTDQATVADPAGCEWLHKIRALMKDDADVLDPLCHDRFDGIERTTADPLALAQKETYEKAAQLIDAITADIELTRRLAALLAGGGGMSNDRRPNANR